MSRSFSPDTQARCASLARSHWMYDAGTIKATEPELTGHRDNVDVAIIGGGFVGLWTAIFAKKERPDVTIVILEKDMCGGGASGRNGGLVLSWWSEILTLIELFGEQDAKRLAIRSEQAITELEEFCAEHNIDADFVRGGWIWAATHERHQGAWQETVGAAERLDESPYRRLNKEELLQRTGSDTHCGGVIDETNATVQPAKLIAGIKRVAGEMGIELYENTTVTQLISGNPAQLITPKATINAKSVVIANNVWACAFPELRKYIAPVTSTLIATKPLGQQLSSTGWKQGDGINNSYRMLSYYRTTHDNRVVYGKSLAQVSWQDRIDQRFSASDQDNQDTLADFNTHYPHLKQSIVKSGWNGPIDYTNAHFPIFGNLKHCPNIVYGVGWSGNGIGPSQIGGRVLASLALGLDNEWSKSALVGTVERNLNTPFPPQPLRYVGARIIRRAVFMCDSYEADNRTPPRLASWLARFAGEIAQ